MATFHNNTFVGQRIQVDGHDFAKNTFENCVLVYAGGPLSFRENLLNNVRWEFADSAARTIGLLSSFYQGGGDGKRFVEVMLATFGKAASAPVAEEKAAALVGAE